MLSDRIFGLVALMVALAYVASATQIQASFMADPVGPRTFPILVGCVAALCALVIILRPDDDPEWPSLRTLGALAFAVAVLVGYAYALGPFGFLLPTAIASGVLSYQIRPRLLPAALTGIGLSAGLFAIFKFILGLGLVALPASFTG